MLFLLCFCCYRFVVVAGHLKSLHCQKPGFLPFENKAGPTDELTDGPTGHNAFASTIKHSRTRECALAHSRVCTRALSSARVRGLQMHKFASARTRECVSARVLGSMI